MNKLLRKIKGGEEGITGLETAIILIAFVVVASVFAYTALSAGLFSTQKSQEAVYSGLKETQSTIEPKGGVIAIGKASMNSCDYPLGWVADTDSTIARETTTKWEGSASISNIIGTDMTQNDEPMYHAMQPLDFTDGDTVVFWIKADAALDSNITFHLATSADLSTDSTESYVINTSGTGWEKHSFDLTGGDDDTAAYYGISLSTDAEGTFYLDKVMVEDLASQQGTRVVLDNCDYVAWTADTDLTMTRETTEKIEGNSSLKGVIGADMSANDAICVYAMAQKDWTDGDTITFWVKAEAALDSDMTFAIGTTADLQASATQTVVVNSSGTGWEKYTLTLSGSDDDSADFYGLYLSTDDAGTFYLDAIQIDAKHSDNSDPMPVYANQLVFTLANVLNGEPIDFSTTTDADTDGIISDESTKSHKVIVTYNDSYQQVTDLAWTKTAIGSDDSDNLLESTEKFQITVDLTYINNNAGWQYKNLNEGSTFTIEVKPPNGAVLVMERTIPAVIKNNNNLN